MIPQTHKRLAIFLGLVCIGLFVLSGCLFWKHAQLKIQVMFASEQTKIFEEMRTKALQSDPAGVAEYLQYIVGYYPSGSKQEAGSRLDRIVENERAHAVQDIIAYLRIKTGEDFGPNPEAWIQKYVKRKRAKKDRQFFAGPFRLAPISAY